MESLSTLNALEKLVKEQKQKSISSVQTNLLKFVTKANYDVVLQMIEELKEAEKENARLIWKQGYISSCFEVQEFFGTDKNPNLGQSDLADIDRDSFEFIKTKFK